MLEVFVKSFIDGDKQNLASQIDMLERVLKKRLWPKELLWVY